MLRQLPRDVRRQIKRGRVKPMPSVVPALPKAPQPVGSFWL